MFFWSSWQFYLEQSYVVVRGSNWESDFCSICHLASSVFSIWRLKFFPSSVLKKNLPELYVNIWHMIRCSQPNAMDKSHHVRKYKNYGFTNIPDSALAGSTPQFSYWAPANIEYESIFDRVCTRLVGQAAEGLATFNKKQRKFSLTLYHYHIIIISLSYTYYLREGCTKKTRKKCGLLPNQGGEGLGG